MKHILFCSESEMNIFNRTMRKPMLAVEKMTISCLYLHNYIPESWKKFWRRIAFRSFLCVTFNCTQVIIVNSKCYLKRFEHILMKECFVSNFPMELTFHFVDEKVLVIIYVALCIILLKFHCYWCWLGTDWYLIGVS